jgi:hypothetical protein
MCEMDGMKEFIETKNIFLSFAQTKYEESFSCSSLTLSSLCYDYK